MNKLFTLVVGAIAVAGCSCGPKAKYVASAISPDGRNEIKIYLNPLAYSVERDGDTMVAYTPISLKVDGGVLAATDPKLVRSEINGSEPAPFYKKSTLDYSRNELELQFADWSLRLAARNDGVAYRYELRRNGMVVVDGESAPVTVPCPCAQTWANYTAAVGCEESVPVAAPAKDLLTFDGGEGWQGYAMIYMPFVYRVNDKFVAITDSDIEDYPIWNLKRSDADVFTRCGGVRLESYFDRAPRKVQHVATDAKWNPSDVEKGGRWVQVREQEKYLVRTAGTRTLPWRVFVLGDEPGALPEADIVRALAPKAVDGDFSWVRPGKVAWDWWNDWNLDGIEVPFKAGCNTKTYEYYIDFAAKNGVEYVIFDEGWSEALNIWKFHPDVDVPHLIGYANERGVGIILWMAWAQIYGEEDRVAEHFAKLGAKGFKVDFMDRGDAEIANFMDKFAAACAKNRMLIDYHGVNRPSGLSRKYPNILNYEGIHGLEQMKFYRQCDDMMFNDVAAFYLRLTAGPMDYTPGAMLNFKPTVKTAADGSRTYGSDYHGDNHNPGSMGTRCRQMAMMALYEAPLQMLCDSPAKYERNRECFSFMAKTPVVWADTVGLKGCPSRVAAVARKAKDGSWYAAAITTAEPLDYTLCTGFLGEGEWKAEIFRDAVPEKDGADSAATPASYVHERRVVAAGEPVPLHLAPGGGFVVKFTK